MENEITSIAVVLRGNLRQEDRTDKKFNLVIDSIKKCLSGISSDINFYMHLWSEDKDEIKTYQKYIKVENIQLESNLEHASYINSICDRFQLPRNHSFAQISSSISLQKACRLIKNKHDLIFVTRPDLFLGEPLNIQNLSENDVYINKHGEFKESGDYVFIVRGDDIHMIENIHDDLITPQNNIVPLTHTWFYEYFIKKGGNVKLCNIEVNVNCEIHKHIENYKEINQNLKEKYTCKINSQY